MNSTEKSGNRKGNKEVEIKEICLSIMIWYVRRLCVQ